jgi:hypothetical protein
MHVLCPRWATHRLLASARLLTLPIVLKVCRRIANDVYEKTAPQAREAKKLIATIAFALLVGVRVLGVCWTSRYIAGTREDWSPIVAQGGMAKDRASAGQNKPQPSKYAMEMLSQLAPETVLRVNVHASNMPDDTHEKMKTAVHTRRASSRCAVGL